MLKMTKTRLELRSDVDMFQFIEKGMRGGTSYIANRHGVANNQYMEEWDDLGKYTEDSDVGFILEVDLRYLKELHDDHNDYPLAPEKV